MSDKTMKNIPKLRFPEFIKSEEWGNTKLGEICKFVRGPFGGSLKKEIFVKDGYAVYEQTHAIYEKFDSFRYYITEEKFNELKRFSVDSSDIIMSCSGTMGKFAIIPKHSKKGVINQALLKLTVKKEFNVNFIKTTLELPENQEKLLSQSAGGAIKNVVSVNQIKDIFVFVPNLLEQKKIADCLSSLDSIISAQSQKIELLKEHKKGLLQNLFPRDGENIPKFRFPEFVNDGEWEKTTIGKIGSFYYGKSAPKWSLEENALTPCVRYGELYTKFGAVITETYSRTNIDPKNLKFSKGGEILIPRVGEKPEDFGKCCCYLPLGNIAIGEMISVFETSQNPLFYTYYFRNLYKKFANVVEGQNVKNLYYVELEPLEIYRPSLEEQQKIADCLNSIDSLITAQNQKVEALKEHKKALLQQLFPSSEANI